MEQIGRRIYYELSTGNVILDTGERQYGVVTTTESQDFSMFTALQPYQQSAVGFIDLPYGQDDANFNAGYPYSVDITQNPPVIKWVTAIIDLANAKSQKKAELLNGYQQTLATGFQSSANGTATTYLYRQIPDQLNYNKIATNVLLGKQTYPFTITDVNGVQQSFTTQAQYTQFATDAGNFDWAQSNQLETLNSQIDVAKTNDAVNAIQWSAASYTHS